MKIDDIPLIGSHMSFPKTRPKFDYLFFIIEIIAPVKDKQYCPKTTKTVIELEVKPEHIYF